MAGTPSALNGPTTEELQEMHGLYRRLGGERRMAPHIVYPDAGCPHTNCQQSLQAIDFRLEAHGKSIHDPLVRAWWDDTGFAGRCPSCGGWIHFTIGGKKTIGADEAAELPQLPANWAEVATIL